MAFLEHSDLKDLYSDSRTDSHIWRADYPNYERLADNGLMEGLDPNLPEVNDGSLAAALFKLPKRIVSSKLTGTVKAINRDEAWLSELANLVWQNEIIPNANTQAPFARKWKDAVRKAAIYGSVPIIILFVEKDGKRHSDFIVAQPQDVTLESGKVSDYDSDVKFWDIFYSKLQLKNIIEQAEIENKEAKKTNKDGYNKWNIPGLKKIYNSNAQESRDGQDEPKQNQDNSKPKGFKFTVAVQEGIEAPFYMYHSDTDEVVREWSNPDPTGDAGIHFLYCYQDMINPYGIGIVKLAGGTQNVLDYMRQADVLATQLGLQPPLDINGDADSVDIDSLIYANRALWFTGNAKVTPVALSNATYQGLPERMSMYKTSLNQLIPTGDTSIASGSGDPNYSKTPAGVKFQAASLSIDDEDFKDNLYITYAAVAKSMINVHFANMEGKDLMKLSDDEREILRKSGLEFPETEDGEVSNQVEIEWDAVRAQFDFEVDPEQDKAKDDADKLEGLMKVAELLASDPEMTNKLAVSKKKLNEGELFSEIISLTSDNDKIITDIAPEDEQSDQIDPTTGQPMPIGIGQDPLQQVDLEAKQQKMQQSDELHQLKLQKMQPQVSNEATTEPTPEEMQANIDAVMQEHGVDENTAITALAAEAQGLPIEDILVELEKRKQQ